MAEKTAAEVTKAYAEQIVAAVREFTDETAEYMVTELLKEYGAKAYHSGRQELAAQVSKIAGNR